MSVGVVGNCNTPDVNAVYFCTQQAGHTGPHTVTITAHKNPADATFGASPTFQSVYTWGP